MNSNILISGDFVINDFWKDKITIGDELLKIFDDSDYNITNLEVPIPKDNAKPIIKTGPNIKGNSELISDILLKLKIDLVTLANNHILDYGEEGLEDTINFCKDNKIDYTGAGPTHQIIIK